MKIPWLVLPVLLPLVMAAASILLSRSHTAQRVLGVTGTALLLASAVGLFASVWTNGIQVTQIGRWPAPFGITLVADLFSGLMVVLAGLTAFVVAVYSLATVDQQRVSLGYYPLLHILSMGVCGAFLTGDLFNLYVWFEVLLIASFVLMALGCERAQIEGAIKYVTLNLLSSALFLVAVGVLYGIAGTLNMADLSVTLRSATNTGLVTTVAILFLVAFGIKAAVFPLFFWLPASYHTPPAAVSAIFAGLLTKVGVYALIRVFTLLFVQDVGYTHTLILVVAALTMLSGVLGAIVQVELRRGLSFQVISTVGYMLMGLGILTPLALAGSVFYIIQDVVVKTNLFLLSGEIRRRRGTEALSRLGGLYGSSPFLAVLFFIPAMSLAGIPPLSGFFAKLALVQAGLSAEQYALVAVALGVSTLTLYSMARIWAEAFWKRSPAEQVEGKATETRVRRASTTPRAQTAGWGLLGPIVVLTGITIALGLAADPVFDLSRRAADQLLDPAAYVDAVLGGRT